MLDWSNVQNNIGSSPDQKDLYNSSHQIQCPTYKPPRSIETTKLKSTQGVLGQGGSDQMKPEQLKRLHRYLITGIQFSSSLTYRKRCRWLSQMEQRIYAHGQRLEDQDPAYLKNLYQLRIAIKKNLKIERAARKTPWLAEMLRIEAIQNVREAYWLNRHYRRQGRFARLNLWRRTDRLRALGQLFFHRTGSSSPVTKHQARVILGIIHRLEKRKTRPWSDICGEVDALVGKLINDLYQRLIVHNSQRSTSRPECADQEKHGYHFGRLSAPPSPTSDSSLRQWPTTGTSPHPGSQGKCSIFSPTATPYRESHRRFKHQMADYLVQAFDLSPNDCKRLQNVLDFMLPLEQIENAPAALKHIRKRVKFALQRDPQITHTLLRSSNTSIDSLCHSFIHKLTAFYHQAMVHFCQQEI